MIDSHAHLADNSFDKDLSRIIAESFQSDLSRILTVSTNLTDSRKNILLSQSNKQIDATAGIHPHNADGWDKIDSPENLRKMATEITAIGEIGLDYHYNFSKPDTQRYVFRKQIQLAVELKKPVVIHCREAFSDLKEILESKDYTLPGGVIHCFTGDQKDAEDLLKMGFYLSFGGMLTFPKLKAIQEVATFCPVDRILLETDCPYLAPSPFRGKRNKPQYVSLIYRKLAELRNMEPEVLIDNIQQNYSICMGINL